MLSTLWLQNLSFLAARAKRESSWVFRLSLSSQAKPASSIEDEWFWARRVYVHLCKGRSTEFLIAFFKKN